jgi:hypothetical protein
MSGRLFSVEEIKNYLIRQDSLGDAVYFLSEERIVEANEIDEREDEEDDDH